MSSFPDAPCSGKPITVTKSSEFLDERTVRLFPRAANELNVPNLYSVPSEFLSTAFWDTQRSHMKGILKSWSSERKALSKVLGLPNGDDFESEDAYGQKILRDIGQIEQRYEAMIGHTWDGSASTAPPPALLWAALKNELKETESACRAALESIKIQNSSSPHLKMKMKNEAAAVHPIWPPGLEMEVLETLNAYVKRDPIVVTIMEHLVEIRKQMTVLEGFGRQVTGPQRSLERIVAVITNVQKLKGASYNVVRMQMTALYRQVQNMDTKWTMKLLPLPEEPSDDAFDNDASRTPRTEKEKSSKRVGSSKKAAKRGRLSDLRDDDDEDEDDDAFVDNSGSVRKKEGMSEFAESLMLTATVDRPKRNRRPARSFTPADVFVDSGAVVSDDDYEPPAKQRQSIGAASTRSGSTVSGVVSPNGSAGDLVSSLATAADRHAVTEPDVDVEAKGALDDSDGMVESPPSQVNTPPAPTLSTSPSSSETSAVTSASSKLPAVNFANNCQVPANGSSGIYTQYFSNLSDSIKDMAAYVQRERMVMENARLFIFQAQSFKPGNFTNNYPLVVVLEQIDKAIQALMAGNTNDYFIYKSAVDAGVDVVRLQQSLGSLEIDMNPVSNSGAASLPMQTMTNNIPPFMNMPLLPTSMPLTSSSALSTISPPIVSAVPSLYLLTAFTPADSFVDSGAVVSDDDYEPPAKQRQSIGAASTRSGSTVSGVVSPNGSAGDLVSSLATAADVHAVTDPDVDVEVKGALDDSDGMVESPPSQVNTPPAPTLRTSPSSETSAVTSTSSKLSTAYWGRGWLKICKLLMIYLILATNTVAAHDEDPPPPSPLLTVQQQKSVFNIAFSAFDGAGEETLQVIKDDPEGKHLAADATRVLANTGSRSLGTSTDELDKAKEVPFVEKQVGKLGLRIGSGGFKGINKYAKQDPTLDHPEDVPAVVSGEIAKEITGGLKKDAAKMFIDNIFATPSSSTQKLFIQKITAPAQ